jgi:hypothetical protein
MYRKIVKVLLVLFILLLINEMCHSIYRQSQRSNIYKMAEVRAKELGKELVVVGDPYYGKGSTFYNMFFDTYGCGDKTIDLTRAPKCKNGIKSDLYNYLVTQQDNSQVIFISCVLEYVDNIEETVKELYRVAGGPRNIFVVTVKNYSFAAYFYKDKYSSSKNIVRAPPEYDTIEWTKL